MQFTDFEPQPRMDGAALSDLLLGKWKQERLESRRVAADPRMQTVHGLTMDEHRARVLEQLGLLVQEGAIQRAFPKKFGGGDNHGGNLASFQELVLADPSLEIKSGVQWGLFGAAILHLGTQSHHERWLPDVLSLKLPGIYAMTETGHGSDVASIATTATFDEDAQEFVIDTPFRAAWKDYLGNAALHGQAAVVFAQLITKGVNYGVHAFFVPVRTAAGEVLPGVGVEDDGYKGGLNGIDNGQLHFSGVRVPRENLLNRYGDVAADGTYSSPIESHGRRFFTTISTLVQGRVSLDGAATRAMSAGLAVAIRYGNERRQFPDTSGRATVLLDYEQHQRRLLPRLAECYAQTFAGERLLRAFDEVFSGRDESDEGRQNLETMAAALKPLSTWAALDTLQETREACGGAGFLAKNRIANLRSDLDIFVTFEGDNTVLLQLVGKRLLKQYAQQFRGADKGQLARAAATQFGEKVGRFGFRQMGQSIADLGQSARGVESLRDTQNMRELLQGRWESMISEVALALREATKNVAAGDTRGKEEALARAAGRQQHKIIEAARAYGEYLQWDSFTAALDEVTHADTREVLGLLHELFGFVLLERHNGWHLIQGRLTGQRAEAVSEHVTELSSRLRPYAQQLVDAFGLSPELLRAEIATGVEQQRQDEAFAYVQAARAKGDWPKHEKELRG